MKFIDLFCGIGGFRFGLEVLGHECVYSSDIDLHCRNCYEDNFGERPYGDIREIRAEDIPNHDMICAGFPCQPFSISGKQGGFSDSRSLFFEIVRIAKVKRPYVILLENVKNIITMRNGDVHEAICASMNELGYSVNWAVLNASDFGVPQSRRRAYYVCIRKDSRLSFKMPQPTHKKTYLEEILDSNSMCEHQILNGRRHSIHITKVNSNYKLRPIRVGYINKAHQGERIYDIKGHAITLSASTGGMGRGTGLYLVNDVVRRLNVREASRVMGFPDRLKITDCPQSFKQLGNAVIPVIVELIAKEIEYE